MDQLDLDDGHLSYVDTGSGEPVVLLHAGYVDHTMWDREIAHLATRCRVIAPDARTHGRSSTATTPFRHCDDVAALLGHLDVGPATLVGISMGAGTALDTALEHPDLVRGVLISGAADPEPAWQDPWLLDVLDRLERAVADMDPHAWMETELRFAAGPHRSIADMDPAVVATLGSMHQHFVSTHVAVPGVRPPVAVTDSWSRLGDVAVPVLGVVGGIDSADYHRMTQAALSRIPDGRALVTIAEAGHLPNLDQPRRWSDVVDAFLTDLGTPAPPAPARSSSEGPRPR